jgi:predicted TIM-barrel fold metal-dependent hydrolase
MTSRRDFLAGAAAAAAAALPLGTAFGQTPKPAPKPKHHGVIDTHHHFWAPEYKKLSMDWDDAHHSPHAPTLTGWSPEVTLAEMDRGGVKTAVLSLASIRDGFWGLDAKAASDMVRICGDYGAKLIADHPGRFGLFAPLNMMDVDLCLKEQEYAFEQLHADGIGVQSSYLDKYPGDPFYNPLWEELNRRKAVVYFHGPVPGCCGGVKVGPGVNPAVEEVTFDMTRAAVSLLANGALARYRDIKWVFSYGGGTVPMLSSRINAFFKDMKNIHDIAPDGVFAELQKLHYDTVNVTDAASWSALINLVKPTQIVYGTDFPYFNNDQLDNIDKRGLSPRDKDAILSGNAKRLMPRLAKV